MTTEELKIRITELLPAAVFEEGGEWLNVYVEPGEWRNMAMMLRNDPAVELDYLFCVTCIDWKTHLTMVYHLTSTKFRHNIVVKSKLNYSNPVIETVSVPVSVGV